MLAPKELRDCSGLRGPTGSALRHLPNNRAGVSTRTRWRGCSSGVQSTNRSSKWTSSIFASAFLSHPLPSLPHKERGEICMCSACLPQLDIRFLHHAAPQRHLVFDIGTEFVRRIPPRLDIELGKSREIGR